MSGRYDVDVTAMSTAPPADVWRLLADASTWSQWGAWHETKLDRDGSPDPNGVGALRRFHPFRFPRVSTVEEVVAFEPPQRLAYELRSGLPVRGYHADVTLEPVDGGTRIRWHSTYDGKFPGIGAVMRPILTRTIRDTAKRLAAAAATPPLSSR